MIVTLFFCAREMCARLANVVQFRTTSMYQITYVSIIFRLLPQSVISKSRICNQSIMCRIGFTVHNYGNKQTSVFLRLCIPKIMF